MPTPTERTSIKVQSERAVLAAVRLPGDQYDERDPFAELTALAQQAGAVVVGTLEQRRQKPESGTYIGSGKLTELRGMCEATDATLIVFDHDLAPKQIAKIEQATERKVLDRSELILDIFASRATTHEAKLQVELAQLEYTYPRLRAMWSHLERIVGGSPTGIGTRGPGEQQLEIDRRIVQRKKTDLRRRLEEIHGRKRRAVSARNVDHFTVGLVGYTNAGKSTLFNTLTEGGAYADDRVFATLMTRTRSWDLGGGLDVMLSDTVGFVRDIPPHLIASFKATLEEATHADLLLVVLDVSDPAAELHYETVMKTLDDLEDEVRRVEGDEPELGSNDRAWAPPERLVLLNKVDLLEDNRDVLVWERMAEGSIAISAKDPGHPGIEALRERVRVAAMGKVRELTLRIPLSDARTIHVIENRGEVLERDYDNGTAVLRVRIGQRPLDQIRSAGGRIEIVGEAPPAAPSAWSSPPPPGP